LSTGTIWRFLPRLATVATHYYVSKDVKGETVFLSEIMGPDFLIVVIVIVVLIFGGAAIPKLARNLGQAKNEFEKGMKAGKTDDSSTKATDAADPNKPDADK
jgi:sec-independent protein translocase protein TatA